MKKRRKKSKIRIDRVLIGFGLVVLIGLIIYYVVFKINDSKELPTGEPIANEEENKNEDATYSLSLVMVGDNLIHSSIYNDANKNAGYDGYDFKPMVTYIKEAIKDYDLAYYNQETILGGSEIGLSDYPTFNSPYEAGDAMIDAGFNLVSLATNHTIDRGEEAVLNSCEYWHQQEGVLYAGSYCSWDERNEVKVMEKNNITYSMLSYTYGTNGIPVPEGKEYLVNVWPTNGYSPSTDTEYQEYKEQVRKDVEAVRDKVDLLMVAMHWGVEYTHTPTAYQEDMAEFLASLGVDIIIGTHPHVIQPVTWIDDTLVVYSLGNFISAQETDLDYAKMVGLMSSVKITKEVKDGETSIKLSDVTNDLLFTYYSGWRNFKVIPFSNPDIHNYTSSADRLYEKYSAVVKNLDDSIPVAALG